MYHFSIGWSYWLYNLPTGNWPCSINWHQISCQIPFPINLHLSAYPNLCSTIYSETGYHFWHIFGIVFLIEKNSAALLLCMIQKTFQVTGAENLAKGVRMQLHILCSNPNWMDKILDCEWIKKITYRNVLYNIMQHYVSKMMK